ncbi:hypothetical protein [Cellulomonas shaoxiangyii]|uniref:Lipoprotein n=1 Tax=Cellulomonas shaoxiangyii TaxID=2566013 RepID=A0A4P7SMU1_9CELL|nr:hypothetical protein [Cellulomonas shaoxiangyii]QCB94566.1 hypothetical protein E5225_14385 [Cellulomonas shaoxiangyii]TGY85028.1 hypothetical protein E5226_08620 [Cellulomonas shaoxiangyii]
MPRRIRTLTGLGAVLALTVALSGCNALRDQVSGPPRDENGVAIVRVVKDAVLEALPDAVDVSTLVRLDGFANTMSLTVTLPDDAVLDVATVQTGARAVCEHVTGYDSMEYGFYQADGRIDLTELWPAAFPGVGRVDRSTADFWEDDCAAILAG